MVLLNRGLILNYLVCSPIFMKKILLSLLLFVWINICYSFWSYESLLSWNIQTLYSTSNLWNTNVIKYSLSSSDLWNIYCLSWTILTNRNTNCNWTQQSPNCTLQFIYWKDNTIYQNNDSVLFYINQLKFETDNTFFGCIEYNYGVNDVNQIIIKTMASTNQNVNIDYDILKYIPDNSWWWSSSCDYSEYESTIQTLSWNLATCQWLYSTCDNNLSSCSNELNACISNWWSSSCSGDIQWSSLYINNIQHLWASSIFVNIPEEISWSYTNQNDEFNLEVEWYNVDTAYIEEVINKSNYIPTSEDLSNVFSNLGLFWSLLVVCLFIILVFYMIKKIFN